MSVPEFIYTVLLKPAPLKRLANGVIRALLPAELHYRGIQLALNPNDPVVSGALLFNVYENDEVDYFQCLLRPGMTVVDVGANIGLYTALAAAGIGPAGRVVALEPDPESFSYLQKTLALNGFTTVEPCAAAASSGTGTAQLFRNPDNRGDSRLYDDPLLANPLAIQTTTLDELLRAHGIRSVDILKMDVQGAEGLVLAGAAQILRDSPNLTIMMEFWPYGLARTGCNAREILHQLRADGFQLVDIGRKFQQLHSDHDFDELVARLQGRRYTNLVASKGSRA